MVLFDLGNRITGALRNLSNKSVVDQEAIDEMLKEIGNALLAADVNLKQVLTMRQNIKAKVNLEEMVSQSYLSS